MPDPAPSSFPCLIVPAIGASTSARGPSAFAASPTPAPPSSGPASAWLPDVPIVWRALLCVLLGATAGCAKSAPAASTSASSATAPAGSAAEAVVVRVVDGDTIRAKIGNRVERVRFIGMDTPEVNALA